MTSQRMKRPAVAVLTMALVLVVGGAVPGVAAPKGGGKPSRDTEQQLWIQPDYGHGVAIWSTDEPSRDTHDGQAADDFIVPRGKVWRITKIDAPGAFSSDRGLTPTYYQRTTLGSPTVDVIFYASGGTAPAGEIMRFDDIALSSHDVDSGYLRLTLPEEVILPEGTYWVSIQVNIDSLLYGGWYWWMSQSWGMEANWRNPQDGFGTGCTDWGTARACTGVWTAGMAFTVIGYSS